VRKLSPETVTKRLSPDVSLEFYFARKTEKLINTEADAIHTI
jgi:hypothetical protein